MQRDKGRKAEAEVRRIWELAGFTVRGLEAGGDHLVLGYGLTIHSEVKRQEVLRLPLWARQASAEAPRSALPVVSFRRNHEDWQAVIPRKAAEPMIERLGWRAVRDYSIRELNLEWWLLVPLVQLACGLAAARVLMEAS